MKSRAPITILFFSLVIVMIGFGIAIPLLPYYVTHFNATGSTLGLMMSIYSLMQFVFAPMWGQLSDRIGRKPVLLIGILGYAISFALQGLSQNIIQLIVWRSLSGMISAATLPTAMAYIADTTSVEDRSKGVGMMGAAMGLGMIIGPLLGGVLTKVHLPLPATFTNLLQVTTDPSNGTLINLSVPFFASSLLAFIAIPFVVAFLPESLTTHQMANVKTSTTSQATQLLDGLRGPIGFLFSMAFLLAFALANMESILGIYGNVRFNMGPSELGFLMGGMGILSVLQQGVVIGPLTRRIGEGNVLKSGLLVSMLGFLGLALAPWKWLAIVFTLVFTVGNVLLQPSVTSLISKRTQTGQGTAMGLNNSFQSLGRGVGPLWAGFAFDIHPTLSFWSGALIQLIAFLAALRILKGEPSIFAETITHPGTIASPSLIQE